MSGNTNEGVWVYNSTATGNIIQGNRIGTNAAGTAGVPNSGAGIRIFTSANNNTIGGTTAGTGNTIAYNTAAGIQLPTGAGTNNRLLGNAIHSNGGLGIDLGGSGVTANDAGDGDSGPNDLLNFPVITSTVASGGTVTATFDLDVPAGNYRVEFFKNTGGADPTGYGEGREFLSAVTVANGTGRTHAFSAAVGDVITATATRDLGAGSYGPTSEFSAAVTVGLLVVNSTGDAADNNAGNGTCATGGTIGGAPECTLRAAIGEANARAGADIIRFDIPAALVGGAHVISPGSALPTITGPVTIDATTEPDYAGSPVVRLDGPSAGGEHRAAVERGRQ